MASACWMAGRLEKAVDYADAAHRIFPVLVPENYAGRSSMAPLYERRTGPKKVAIESTVSPYSLWNPILPGQKTLPSRDQFVWSKLDPGPLPNRDEDIAFAPLTQLARWVEKRQITSVRLTNIYLDRLQRFGGRSDLMGLDYRAK